MLLIGETEAESEDGSTHAFPVVCSSRGVQLVDSLHLLWSRQTREEEFPAWDKANCVFLLKGPHRSRIAYKNLRVAQPGPL